MAEVHTGSAIHPNYVQGFTLIVRPDGTVESPWWTPEIDLVLEELGVPQNDVNRMPWCG